ncbi:MAG: tetratricopeptide repeat protein [Spirochaetales bacterium]|nr:tetratricopeptide repeat protein [Spirochaetales bacterium]
MLRIAVLAGFVGLFLGCSSPPLSESALRAYVDAKNAYEHGDFTRSKTGLSAILKDRPDFFQARFLRAKIEFFSNDLISSQNDLQRVTKEHPDHLQARFWSALVDLQSGRVEDAAHRIDDLLALDPQDYRLLYERGLLYLKKGDVKNALDFFHQASLDEADLAKPRLEAGRLFYTLGDSFQAQEQLERAKVLVGERSPLSATLTTLITTVQSEKKKSSAASKSQAR